MSEITTSTVHSIAGKDVIFKELSVAEIRTLMQRDREPDLVGNSLFTEMPLSDLPAFSSLTSEEVDALKPSQVREAIQRCKAANPDFFEWLARISVPPAKP
jgi:hypothetical protein